MGAIISGALVLGATLLLGLGRKLLVWLSPVDLALGLPGFILGPIFLPYLRMLATPALIAAGFIGMLVIGIATIWVLYGIAAAITISAGFLTGPLAIVVVPGLALLWLGLGLYPGISTAIGAGVGALVLLGLFLLYLAPSVFLPLLYLFPIGRLVPGTIGLVLVTLALGFGWLGYQAVLVLLSAGSWVVGALVGLFAAASGVIWLAGWIVTLGLIAAVFIPVLGPIVFVANFLFLPVVWLVRKAAFICMVGFGMFAAYNFVWPIAMAILPSYAGVLLIVGGAWGLGVLFTLLSPLTGYALNVLGWKIVRSLAHGGIFGLLALGTTPLGALIGGIIGALVGGLLVPGNLLGLGLAMLGGVLGGFVGVPLLSVALTGSIGSVIGALGLGLSSRAIGHIVGLFIGGFNGAALLGIPAALLGALLGVLPGALAGRIGAIILGAIPSLLIGGFLGLIGGALLGILPGGFFGHIAGRVIGLGAGLLGGFWLPALGINGLLGVIPGVILGILGGKLLGFVLGGAIGGGLVGFLPGVILGVVTAVIGALIGGILGSLLGIPGSIIGALVGSLAGTSGATFLTIVVPALRKKAKELGLPVSDLSDEEEIQEITMTFNAVFPYAKRGLITGLVLGALAAVVAAIIGAGIGALIGALPGALTLNFILAGIGALVVGTIFGATVAVIALGAGAVLGTIIGTAIGVANYKNKKSNAAPSASVKVKKGNKANNAKKAPKAGNAKKANKSAKRTGNSQTDYALAA